MRARRVCASGLALFFCFFPFFMRPLSRAATPLQKIVFVFTGFNERSGFIFTAKAEELIDERIVRKLEREGALPR